VARKGKENSVYSVIVGGAEEMRPLGTSRRRWEDNIKMDLREIKSGCELDVTASE